MPAAPRRRRWSAWSRASRARRASTCCSTCCRNCSRHARLAFRRARQRRAALRALHARAAGALPGPRRVLQRLQRGTRALHRGRSGHLPDAVAVRAVRPQPDVQPEVRHRARSCGAPAGSPTRCSTSIPATGHGTGIVFNDFDPGGVRWALATGARVVRLAERVAPAGAERDARRTSPGTAGCGVRALYERSCRWD